MFVVLGAMIMTRHKPQTSTVGRQAILKLRVEFIGSDGVRTDVGIV